MLPPWIGIGAASRAVAKEADQLARSDVKVFITGEAGVGKEIVARRIHESGPRSGRAFIVINCASLPDALLESELFGHVRGSFTGAYRDKTGKLALADGGTVFLDDIDHLSLRMQGLLLHFLMTSTLRRIGDDEERSVNVRVMTGTTAAPDDLLASPTFRQDLFYRMNVIRLHIPPLRERREDVAALLNYFLRDFSDAHGIDVPRVDANAMSMLAAAAWPRNLDQVREVAEQLVSSRINAVTVGVSSDIVTD